MMEAKRMAAVVAALVLTGCGTGPVTIKASFEGEKRLSLAKPKGTAAAKAVLEGGAGGTPVRGPAAKVTPAPVRIPVIAADEVATEAAAEPAGAPTLAFIAGPKTTLRALPFRNPEGEAEDMLADPADGMARFEVQAPPTGLVLTGARIEVAAGDQSASVDQTAKELEWPARIAYRTSLAVPYTLFETLEVMSLAPDAKRLTVKATLLGEGGVEIDGEDGEPLVLEAQVDVL